MNIGTGMMMGIIYTAIMVPLVAYLLYRDRLKKEMGLVILVLSVLMGLVYFAPMFPWQLQLLMLGRIPRTNLPMVLVAAAVVALSPLLMGRVFCGYICPPGTLQELAYLTPWKKVEVASSITTKVRWLALILIVATAVLLSLNLTKLLGLQDLFTLVLEPGTIVFLAIISLSTVVYRPFCRLICPFGALSSIFAGRSMLGVRRTEGCVDCDRCVKVCPPQVLKERAGSECYLCGRCMEACHKDALKYSKDEARK